MYDSSLIKSLKSFSKEEIREFGRFVDSPFLNGRKESAKYFHALKRFYPQFSSRSFTKENLFSKVFSHKKFNDADIRRLNSSLMKLIESYFSIKGLSGDDYYFQMALLEQYNIRGLNHQFDKRLDYINDAYKNFNGDSENYFWKKFFIEREMHSHYMLTQRDHLATESISNRADYFSYHTVINLCKTLTSLSINEKNFNAEFSKGDFFELVKRTNLEDYIHHLEKTKNKSYPLVAIHFYQAMAFRNLDNDFYFNRYKELLVSSVDNFSYIEKINFYTIFEAICTLKIEQGNISVSKELFESYNRMLKLGLYSFTEGGDFILKLFRNFILVGIQMKEIKWLNEFLKNHLGKLHSDSRTNMKNFADAYILFEEKKFDKALESLSKIDYEIFHFKIDIKNLQLKIYYELNLFDEAYSLIDTYKHFIAHNKFISERYKSLAGNFVGFVHRLLKAKESEDKSEAHLIEKELKEKKNTLFEEWVRFKIADLKS